MAIETDNKKTEHPRLLGLGFKEGEDLSNRFPFLKDIPAKVGKEGEVLWKTRDSYAVWLNNVEPWIDFAKRRKANSYLAIFRAWHMFEMALMGFPVRLNWGRGWPLEPAPAPWSVDGVATLWERAPRQIQEMTLKSAMYYLHPDLSI